MENEKLKCEVEYYTLHKLFYGNGAAKFLQTTYSQKKAWFSHNFFNYAFELTYGPLL